MPIADGWTGRTGCPVCGAQLPQDDLGKEVARCPKCALLYRTSVPSSTTVDEWETFTFDSQNTAYDLSRAAYFAYLWTHIRRITGKRHGRFLDVGCGPGLLLRPAGLDGWDAEGMEVSPKQCAAASGYSGCPVHCGPLENADLEPGSYDLITMIDVWRHLIDPMDTTQACMRLLKPGGALVIRELNIDNSHTLSGLSRLMSGKPAPWDPFLQGLSAPSARFLSEAAGMETCRLRPSPMSLQTIPGLRGMSETRKTKMMRAANRALQIAYIASLGRWLRISPELLLIGTKG
jgi:SAM-dependent methyltransferase